MLRCCEVKGPLAIFDINTKELAIHVPVEKQSWEKNELSKFIIAFFAWSEY